MNFRGYKEVTVSELNIKMLSALGKSQFSCVDIASKIKTTSQAIDNTFKTHESKRYHTTTFKASDRLVCQVAKTLGINLAVIENGEKKYFINNSKK